MTTPRADLAPATSATRRAKTAMGRRGPRPESAASQPVGEASHGAPILPVIPRRIGRPRSGTADRAILDAAMALLSEVGLAGLTMSAVVSRSGVARATVYRRYRTREALIAAALAQVKGREPFRLTDDIVADIATGVAWAAAILNETAFQRFLPLFVGEALRGPTAARNLIERVAPNHAEIAGAYAERAADAGLRTDIDPFLVSDIVQGTMLMRLLSTGTPPDSVAASQLVEILLRGLREPADAPASVGDRAEG